MGRLVGSLLSNRTRERRRPKTRDDPRSPPYLRSSDLDLQAGTVGKRVLDENATHGMWGGDDQQALLGQTAMYDKRARVNNVKNWILRAESTGDLMDRAARAIEEDWLAGMSELPGNVYRMAAYGRIFWFDPEVHCLRDLSRMTGSLLIWIFQIFGAPTLVLAYGLGIGVACDEVVHFEKGFLASGLAAEWKEVWLAKVLGMLAIMIFCFNAAFVVMDERKAFDQMHRMFTYLNERTESVLHGEFFLFLDAFTNCWVVTWVCISTVLVLGPAASPKDVLFDSLGLLFLYNLDDIGGDLGFLGTDDWDGFRLNWIYEEMVVTNWPLEVMENRFQERGFHVLMRKMANCGYWLAIAFVTAFGFISPIIVAITAFSATKVEKDAVTGLCPA